MQENQSRKGVIERVRGVLTSDLGEFLNEELRSRGYVSMEQKYGTKVNFYDISFQNTSEIFSVHINPYDRKQYRLHFFVTLANPTPNTEMLQVKDKIVGELGTMSGDNYMGDYTNLQSVAYDGWFNVDFTLKIPQPTQQTAQTIGWIVDMVHKYISPLGIQKKESAETYTQK